jgi:N-acyl amino acid synthase of PEP-CTERM/exosortase system
VDTNFFRFFQVTAGTEQYERYLEFRHEVFCEELQRVSTIRDVLSARGRPMETDCYDAYSRHFLAVHRTSGETAGCARLILPNPLGLNVSARYVIDQRSIEGVPEDQIGEISRMAVSRRFRRRREDLHASATGSPQEEVKFTSDGKRRHQPELVLGMYREVFLCCSQVGVKYCFAAMDERFSRLLQTIGFPFRAVGPVNRYVSPARRVFFVSGKEIEQHLSRRDQRVLYFLSGQQTYPQQ